jgi:hypothetical protein
MGQEKLKRTQKRKTIFAIFYRKNESKTPQKLTIPILPQNRKGFI